MSDRDTLERLVHRFDAGDRDFAELHILVSRVRQVLDGKRRADRLIAMGHRGRHQIVDWRMLAGWYYWLRSQCDFSQDSDKYLRKVVAALTGINQRTVSEAARRHAHEAVTLVSNIELERKRDAAAFMRRLLRAYGKPIAAQEFRQLNCTPNLFATVETLQKNGCDDEIISH